MKFYIEISFDKHDEDEMQFCNSLIDTLLYTDGFDTSYLSYSKTETDNSISYIISSIEEEEEEEINDNIQFIGDTDSSTYISKLWELLQ